MANSDAKENGMYAWMASVRASMDNDSSRKIFEDQVQSHAFIFLDNYLEHILAGPKQAPIIELVKTPGRKRNIPRRTRAATAAAATVKSTMPLSLDDDTSSRNVIPVNSFHKALLQAKERSVQDALDMHKSTTDLPSVSNEPAENMPVTFISPQLADIPKVTISMKPESQAGVLPFQHYPRDPSSGIPFLPPEHGTQLSVIAEGDESPGRSPAPTLVLDGLPQFHYQVQEHLATEDNSISVQADHGSQGDPSPDVAYPIPSPVDARPLEVQSPRSHTEPLPSRTANHSPKNRERSAFTAPLPTIPISNSIPVPQTISVPLNDASPNMLPYKSSAAGFPTLPAPSPLRKSMRVPQDVPASIVHPTIAPAPVPLGKRTSWLKKAREAKAMDGPSTLTSTAMAVTSAAVPRASTAVKRKSEEMLGALPPPDIDKDQRRPKVSKSTEALFVPPISQDTEKTIRPDLPSAQDKPVALTSIATVMPVHHLESHAMDVDKDMDSAEEGFIDLFKRTVEGLGARAARSTGKSFGGAVVAALAEARAAAEARVAERNKVNVNSSDSETICDSGLPDEEPLETQALQAPSPEAEKTEGRLSLSDLVPVTVQRNELEVLTKTVQPMERNTRIDSGNESDSTTPPDSPPSKGSSGFVKPTGPVFNKPPPQPVFMPPASKQASVASEFPKEFTSHIPSEQFTLPAAVTLGIPAKLNTPLQSSIFSNPVFDKRDGIPTWVPSTQGTLYNTDSQRCDPQPATALVDDDDDDSWPLEEKLAAAESGWRPFDFSNVDKEDTWSSLPTESQGPTRSLILDDRDVGNANGERAEMEPQAVEISDTEGSISDSGKPEEFIEASVDSEPVIRSTSQTSMASTTSSSQPQVGFLSQATKLVNNMLGGSKKAKPELKSLQLAAAAAKKQQEEADKKLQRLKDMEARRQVAIAKKAEDERTRLLEEEKKNREECEKRKREREENTDRRPLKPPMSAKKADDDGSKKRKVAQETEKKLESKKPSSRDKKDLVPQTKLAITPATKAAGSKRAKSTAAALISSAAYNATQNPSSAKPIIPEAKPFKVVPSLKGKVKAKPQEDDIGDKLPSTMVQSQMAARVKAQMQSAKMVTPEVPSESIELPDINSEYSDSGDEDRVRAFDPPEWAQSPELRQALQMQSTVNPDEIFGEIRPLRMEEMFRTRQSRFRARTSSANWSGTDRLTAEEIREYERRMGFQSTRAS